MPSHNRVHLIGNLTRDPELKYIQSGAPVASFGLAVNESYKTKEGTKVDETVFVDITAWSRLAEICNEYLHKGSCIFCEGKLKFDQWEKDGQKRSKLSVTMLSMQILDSKGSGPKQTKEEAQPEPNYNTSQDTQPTQESQASEDDSIPF
jgi:single-strand DNA-binding protein